SISSSPKYDAAGLAETAILATAESSARAPAARIDATRIASATDASQPPRPAIRHPKEATIQGSRMLSLLAVYEPSVKRAPRLVCRHEGRWAALRSGIIEAVGEKRTIRSHISQECTTAGA